MIEIYFLLYVVRSDVPSQTNIHMGPRSDIFSTMTDFNQLRRSFILATLLLHHMISFSTGCVPLAWCLSQLPLLSDSTTGVCILSEVGGSLTLFKNITSLLFDMDSGRVWWVYGLIISVQSGILGMAYQLCWFSKPCLHNFYCVVMFQY